MMVDVTLNTVLYGLLTIIIGLAIHLLVSPKKKKVEGEIDVEEFDDLVKGVDDWHTEDEDDDDDDDDDKGTLPTVTGSNKSGGGASATSAARAAAVTPSSSIEAAALFKKSKGGDGGVLPIPSSSPELPSEHQEEPVEKIVVTTHDKFGNLLPYQIGDRVIVQKLSGPKELNGRHGVIAGNGYDVSTQRYCIDLDLIDDKRRNKPSLSVKGDNLKKESTESTLKIIPFSNSSSSPDAVDDTTAEDKKDNDNDGKDDNDDNNNNNNNKNSSSSPIVQNGCLIPHHSKSAAFIWDVYRKSVISSMRGPPGTTPPGTPLPPQDKIVEFGWDHWKSKSAIAKQNAAKAGGFCDGLGMFLGKNILLNQKLTDLDKQVSPDPKDPIKGAYKLVIEAMSSIHAVKSWNVRIEGDFWIVKQTPTDGTYVSYVYNPRQVYLVQGYNGTPLTSVITKNGQIQYPRPPKFHLCLVPWFGTLIHDPIIRSTTGTNQIELASPILTKQLLNFVTLAEKQNRIISSLKQLDVKGGSMEGLPYQRPTITPPPSLQGAVAGGGGGSMPQPPIQKQEPATEGERILVDNLTDFTNVLNPPEGMWSILPERTINPNVAAAKGNSYVILSGNGQKLGDFTKSSKTSPATAEDYLKGILTHCSSSNSSVGGSGGDRPSMIGVDDPSICQRLQFLLHGNLQNCRVVLLQVKKKRPAGQGSSQGLPGGGGGFAENPPLPLP